MTTTRVNKNHIESSKSSMNLATPIRLVIPTKPLTLANLKPLTLANLKPKPQYYGAKELHFKNKKKHFRDKRMCFMIPSATIT